MTRFQQKSVLSFDEAFIKEINSCRRNPQKYSLKIRDFMNKVDGNKLMVSNTELIKLEEGVDGLEELAMFLDNLDAVPVLKPSKGLTKVCEELQDKIANSNNREEPICLKINKSLSKYGEIYGPFSQHIEYYIERPELVVLMLLLDEQDEMKTNRMNLLNPNFKLIGVCQRRHKYFTFTTIFNLARHFYPFFEKPEEGQSSSDEEFEKYNVHEDDIDYFNAKLGDKMTRTENIAKELGHEVKFVKVMEVKDGILTTKIFREDLNK